MKEGQESRGDPRIIETFEHLWGSLHFFLCQGINAHKETKEECPSSDCTQAREAWEVLQKTTWMVLPRV